MIELTPLDVRKKKGDFRRGLRGYEPALVDDFLDVVADRMETLVRDAAAVGDRIARLEQQVADYRDRERALTEALVTAQQMREDMRSQSRKEIELLQREAEREASQIRADAVKAREREEETLRALRARQLQFITSYKAYLEQEISDISALARGIDMYASGTSGAISAVPPPQASSAGYAAPPPAVPPATPPSPVSAAPPAAAEQGRQQPAPAVARVPAPSSLPPSPSPVPRTGATAQRATQATAAAGAASAGPATRPVQVAQAPGPRSQPCSAASTPAATSSATPAAAAERSDSGEVAGGWSPDAYESDTAASRTVTHETVREEVDELDAQLEEALARWEPELEPDAAGTAAAAVEDDELILSDDDVINAASTTGAAEARSPSDEDTIDDIMDFLDLEDEPVREARPSANGKGHGPPAVADERDVATSVSGPADDDDFVALAAILAEEEADSPETSGPAAGISAGDDHADEPVDPDARNGASPEPSFADVESEFPDDSEFFNGEGREGSRRKADSDYGDPFSSGEEDSEGNLIDLDSMGALTRYEPAGGGSPDTSTLTLHPMFFDQDSPDLPGTLDSNGTEKDPDRWS